MEFGEAIRLGLRNWLVYRGRASRSAYWWFILFMAIVVFAVDLIAVVIGASVRNAVAAGVLIVVLVVVSVAYPALAWLALAVRRLHDTGKSGWWVLIELVPFVGPIIFLVHMLPKGTPGLNRYDLAAASALPTRCLECGAETAAGAQACARCGAPVTYQPPAANAAAGGPVSSTGLPSELVGQRTLPGSWRNALVITGAGLGGLAAVIVVVALATSPTSSNSPKSSSSPKSPGPSSSPGSPAAAASQLAYDQLRPGDCLQVPHINTISTFPDLFTAVPCARPHTGEVFFAGDIWPQSLAYPGDKAISDQADARCARAFTAYDGISPDQSGIDYVYLPPDSTGWSSGDRSVQCIAYDPSGASMNYSIKGSSR